ncbi:hypothetical protein CsSME_00051831 [Camellia sinensis var. sinensis]
MEKSIINVKLTNRPPMRDSQGKNNPNGGGFDNRTESLQIIHTILLVNPLTTKRALYRSRVPSALRLIRYTHLQPTRFMAGEQGTKDQVPLRIKALISLVIVARHCGNLLASVKHVGSISEKLGKEGE